MTTRKLATATLFTGIAVTLAACGAGISSHVVQRIPPLTSVAPRSTTTAAFPGSVPVPAPAPGAPTTAPSATLNAQTVDQVATELGGLDNSLSTANSDLNHPQGDS
jgi:hypothetical protein